MLNRFSGWLVLLCAMTLSLSMSVSAAKKSYKKLDGIAAVVGNDVITGRELAQTMKALSRQDDGNPPPVQQVLESLIVQRLQLYEARKRGITVDELALDRAMEKLAENNQMSLDEIREATEKQGIPYPDLRESVRERLITQRLVQQVVINNIEVSEREIATALESQNIDAEQEYHFTHITAKDIKLATELRKIRQELRGKPQTIAALRTHFKKRWKTPDDKAKYQVRDFGWRKKTQLPNALKKRVGQLSVGQLSPVIKQSDALHLFQLVGTRNLVPGEKRTSYKARHILVVPTVLDDDNAVQRQLKRMRNAIKNGKKDFDALAKRYSSDHGSSFKGGELGWIFPEQMTPEFADKVRTTPIGEIAGPFRTQFGWHLLEIVDERTESMGLEELKKGLSAQIRQQKSQNEIRQWLIELRNKHYVEVRIKDNLL